MPDDYSLLRSGYGRLITASEHVNEKFLGTPYGSTPIHRRLLNQRFLIELTDPQGQKIYVQNNRFYSAKGIEIKYKNSPVTVKVSVKEPMPEILTSITYNDVVSALYRPTTTPPPPRYTAENWAMKRKAFLKACDQGQVKIEPDVEALQGAGFTVNHVIHRPNHGLHHSMRTAASIPLILGYHGVSKSPAEVEKLQHMMLFSVVGRQDETGISETGEWGEGKTAYEGFRTTSGLAYLDYCGSRDDIYTALEKQLHTHYRDALTVELMGFDDVENALQVIKGEDLSQKWIKDRILKDTKRLVEMGTLTSEEALRLVEAANKEEKADELVQIVMDPKNNRYVLESSIPGALVRFISANYESLGQKHHLTDQQFGQIKAATSDAERDAVIKTLLPQILEDRSKRDLIFPFIKSQEAIINDGLKWMNYSHAYDLSRCYELEASYMMQVIKMPGDTDMTALDWEIKLTDKLSQNNQKDIDSLANENGFLVLKASDGTFYIRHRDDKKNIQYSKVDKSDLPIKGIFEEALSTSPHVKYLKHSHILAHIIDKKGNPEGKPQLYGDEEISTCFNKSNSWDTFKTQMQKLYEFFNAMQEMQLRTGERINFMLHKKQDFQAFLNAPETKDLYEKYKIEGDSFAARFTLKALPRLYNASNSQNYDYPQAFRIFAGTPAVTAIRDYRTEALNCARLIDSGPKPSFSLKTDQIPEIQTLKYDPNAKKMTLTFASKADAKNFQQLHQELIKPSSDALSSDGLSVIISLADYKYLRDNRHLRYKLEKVPEKINEEEELLDPDTGEYRALQLIKQQRGVVRLHNTVLDATGKRPYDYELAAMADPMHDRRVTNPSRLGLLGELEHLTQRRNIQSPQTKEIRTRGEQLERTPPDPHYQEPSLPELDHPDLDLDAIYQKQGGVKNTRFIKKASHTLLDPNGASQLFMGAMRVRNQYMPLGILSDLDKMQKGGGEYIWTGRANTWKKYWLRGAEKENSGSALGELLQGITLEKLKEQQNGDVDPNEHNELLLCASKDAIRALTATKNTLIDRLNLVVQAMHIKEKFGISVPLIILDPTDPECPKPYTEEMIRKDIDETLKSVRNHQFEYDHRLVPDYDNLYVAQSFPRDYEVQNQVLTQLLNGCGFTVTSIPNKELPKDRLFISPQAKEGEERERIESYLKKLHIPGGIYAQSQQISNPGTFDALPLRKKDTFFIKQFALGNEDVIKQLITTCRYKPSKDMFTKALEIASRLQGAEFAGKLAGDLLKISTTLATEATDKIKNVRIPRETGLLNAASYCRQLFVLSANEKKIAEYRQELSDIVKSVKKNFDTENPDIGIPSPGMIDLLESMFRQFKNDGSSIVGILPKNLTDTRQQLEQYFNAYFVAAHIVNVILPTPIVSAQQPPASSDSAAVIAELTGVMARIQPYKDFGPYIFGDYLFDKTRRVIEQMRPGDCRQLDSQKPNFLTTIRAKFLVKDVSVEILQQFIKHKDALDRGIIFARTIIPQTAELTAFIAKAEQIYQGLLTEQQMSSISTALQLLVDLVCTPADTFTHNVVDIVSSSRNNESPISDQLELAIMAYQYKNKGSEFPINETCKAYLLALAKTKPDAVKDILDIMWRGESDKLTSKADEIFSAASESRDKTISPARQMEFAVLQYQYKIEKNQGLEQEKLILEVNSIEKELAGEKQRLQEIETDAVNRETIFGIRGEKDYSVYQAFKKLKKLLTERCTDIKSIKDAYIIIQPSLYGKNKKFTSGYIDFLIMPSELRNSTIQHIRSGVRTLLTQIPGLSRVSNYWGVSDILRGLTKVSRYLNGPSTLEQGMAEIFTDGGLAQEIKLLNEKATNSFFSLIQAVSLSNFSEESDQQIFRQCYEALQPFLSKIDPIFDNSSFRGGLIKPRNFQEAAKKILDNEGKLLELIDGYRESKEIEAQKCNERIISIEGRLEKQRSKLKPKKIIQSPINELCKAFLERLYAYCPNEVSKLLDAIWEWDSVKLRAQEKVILELPRDKTLTYAEQIDMAILKYQYINKTSESPINERCKAYLVALKDSHPKTVSKLLDAMWIGIKVTSQSIEEKIFVLKFKDKHAEFLTRDKMGVVEAKNETMMKYRP